MSDRGIPVIELVREAYRAGTAVRTSAAALAGFVLLATIMLQAVPAGAADAKGAAMVFDMNSGDILYNSDGDEPRYPASLTKIMTLYMAFDLIERGRLSYTDRIKVSAFAAAKQPSKLGLKAGQTIAFKDAARALITKSANDVAAAVAEHIGGSEANFARLMTEKARAIGMRNTTFKNASGLPDARQKTTARDMITLGVRLQDDFPEHYKLFKTVYFAHGGKRYRNYNKFLRTYRGTDGIKTGYTRASGFNLVTSVKRDGKHIVAAVFGGRTGSLRDARMQRVLALGFKKASRTQTRKRRPLLIAKPKMLREQQQTLSARAAPVAAPPPVQRSSVASQRAQATITIASVRPTSVIPQPRPPELRPLPDVSPDVSPEPVQVALTEPMTTTRASPAGLPNRLEQFSDGLRTSQPTNAAQIAAPIEAYDPQPSSAIEVAQLSPPVGLSAPAPPSFGSTDASNDELGRPPSTFQAQLASLSPPNASYAAQPSARDRPSAPQTEPFALRGPTDPAPVAPATVARGGYAIQVGAYRSAEEAGQRLRQVSQSASGILASARLATERVDSGQRAPMYRARFAGFTSARATQTCTELRRRGIDCFVARSN